MMSIDFAAYLAKLGIHDEQLNPDLPTLGRLQLAHLVAFPFQSLSTILQRPIALDASSLYQKLVVDGRGGYCYELNLLFWHLLQHLGYDTQAITAAIVHDNQPDIPHAHTHMLLSVEVEHDTYLVDVGFGGLVPTAPLAIHSESTQTTPHGNYRITPHQQRFVLSTQVNDEWRMLYDFDLQAQNLVDLEVGNWYVSTHPQSPFRQRLMAARVEPNGTRHALLNTRYTVYTPNQDSTSHTLHNADEVFTILQRQFKMTLPNDASIHKAIQQFITIWSKSN